MPSPFPGMDPYLEDARLWPQFQHEFLSQLAEFIRRRARAEYSLRLDEYSYTHNLTLFTSVVQEEHREKFLEIRTRNNRLVTRIELLGIGIRTLSTGRDHYLRLRQATQQLGSNLVEIDLVLQGQSPIPVDRAQLPPFDYLVCVSRVRRPDCYEVYTTTLDRRLPRIRVPMLPDDNDVVVDLQEIFDRTYDRSFAQQLDYRKPPPVLLPDESARWVEQVLRPYRIS
ncbi:MAG: DUF4058 family protein [Gemmatales bacterium]|nr:DUF4058 family protein [Gemmatales bacterium]MDW7993166.1 DUF4058 family protein [Gemmatales bacterium]